MQADLNLVQAQRFDRVGQFDLLACDGEACFNHFARNVAGVDRAIQLAGFASLANQNNGQTIKFLADLFSFGALFKVDGFKLGALGFKMFAVFFRRAQRLVLRQQVITGITRFDRHNFAHLAKFLDPFQKNDFHVLLLTRLYGYLFDASLSVGFIFIVPAWAGIFKASAQTDPLLQ